jgi:transposase
MTLKLREMTSAEQMAIKRLARSRTASAREVERARIVNLAGEGQRVPTIAARLEVAAKTVRTWLKRFNTEGLDGLRDQPRSGRPTTYTPEQVSEVVAAALTNPQDLKLPFGCWTLDRLAIYLREEKNLSIKRSRIDELLIAEGLRWRKQETWFGERVDPEFAKKRGASKNSTPRRLKGAS